MDKATETQLSLYLDGLLPAEERRGFEARMEKDAELRRAVALHREASGEMESLPQLPTGFTARARARLERESAAAAAPWWHRFWSLETAGVLVSAGIMMLAIVPFLLQRDRASEEILVAQKKISRQEAALDKAEPVLEPSAAAPGRGDAASEEIAAETSRQKVDHLTARSWPDDEDEAQVMLNEETLGEDHPAFEPKKRAADPRDREQQELLREADDGKAAAPKGAGTDDTRASGQEPAKDPGLKVEITSAELKDVSARERPLANQALQLAEAGSRPRSIPVAGAVRLNESGFIVIRNESELAALRAGAGGKAGVDGYVAHRTGAETEQFFYDAPSPAIDFDREMGILLPAWRDTPEPVRVEVVSVIATETDLVILYRESPAGDEDGDPTAIAPMQLVIFSASELPIRLRKLD